MTDQERVRSHSASLTPDLSPAQVELLEAFTGFEEGNKYAITTTSGQGVYWAAEQSGCCNRNCCGRGRSFRMKVIDSQQSEVLSLERPLR